MKSFFALILVILLILGILTGCGNAEPKEDISAETTELTGLEETEDMPDVVESAEDLESAGEPEQTTVEEGAFSVDDLGDGTCVVNACRSNAAVIEVPETIYGLTVVGIGAYAFGVCDAEQIILPDTVEYIEGNAFGACDNLKHVDFGSGLKSIGGSAFMQCPALETVEFPDGMITVSDMVFGSCENLGEVIIPASVTEMGKHITYSILCPSIVIVTPAGSTAEAVALETGLPVVNS